jgi:hypothetical protein
MIGISKSLVSVSTAQRANVLGRFLVLVAIIVGLSAPAAAGEIAPHRALYEVTMVGPAQNIDDAVGLLSVEISQSCEQWTYSQRFELKLIQEGADLDDFSFRLTAWESLDGNRYGFRSTTSQGEDAGVKLVGRGEINPNGAGLAKYTEPAAFERPLTAGVLFPIGWLKAGLAASEAGEKRFSGHVFMGAAPDEPLRVNSIIVTADAVSQGEVLLRGPRWRYLSAFYNQTSAEVPEYEAEETVLANGVLAGALMRHPTYALQLKLHRIEALPGPSDC